MKAIQLTLGIASGFFLAACSGSGWGTTHSSVSNSGRPTATADEDDDDDGDDQDIALSALPEVVKNAALGAVPGFEMTKAEIEKHGDKTIYSIDGVAGGEECCVEVSPDGTVIAVEHEDDEDDD